MRTSVSRRSDEDHPHGRDDMADIRSAIERGFATVVVAVGSTEQHGPHLPTMTDTRIGDAVAERVARRLGNAGGPDGPVGVSEHHLAFGGTVSLKPETLRLVLRDYIDSLGPPGFLVEFPARPLGIGGNLDIRPITFRIGKVGVKHYPPRIPAGTDSRLSYHWNDRQSLATAVEICRRRKVNIGAIRRWSTLEGCDGQVPDVSRLPGRHRGRSSGTGKPVRHPGVAVGSGKESLPRLPCGLSFSGR